VRGEDRIPQGARFARRRQPASPARAAETRFARRGGRLMRPVDAMRRSAVLSAGALALAALGGCGIWPWSSSKPRLPELPPVTTAARASVAWSVSLPAAGVGFQPVFAGGSVWAAARDGTVVRVDPASGRPLWRSNAGQPLQ